MANVLIDIASEFTGKKAFKQAETSTEKLTKNVKKMAGALGLAFSGQQILAFGKASIKAAAADEKAQKQLALALKNVGLGRDAAASEDYIQKLQSEFGIVDDKLRPAYQTLAVATKDTALSQKLLNLALDISAATGKDLGSVTGALSKAYLGNNAALSRLGVGISKADLKAGKFEDIISQLETTFAGSATAAANTFQGSMDKLGVASANVSEIIGTGLIDALKGLGDNNTIDEFSVAMESTALYIADIIRGIGVVIGQIKTVSGIVDKIPGASKITDLLLKLNPVSSGLSMLNQLGQNARVGTGGGFPQGAPAEYQAAADARAAEAARIAEEKARKAAALAAAKLAASQKKTLKAQQDALKLAKARAVFDLQKIQIEAALKGKISAEDEIRLKLMKAILDENMTDIEKYQEALGVAQIKTKELSDLLTAIKTLEIKDPFGAWSVDPLTASINELTKSMFSVGTQIQANGREWSSFANSVASTVIRPNLTEWSSSFSSAAASAAAATASANASLASTSAAASAAASKAAADQAAALQAQQDALTAQTTAASAALQAQGAAQLEALKARLAEEAAAYKELMEATAAAAEAALLTGANEYTTGNLAKVASEAAAQAAAASAAEAAAGQALSAVTGGTTKIEVTVSGDPFTDPNAVAEKVVEIIRSAANRGTVDVLGFE